MTSQPFDAAARAREIIACGETGAGTHVLLRWEQLHAAIAAALTAVRDEERARAAKLADDWRCTGHEHDCGCPLCGVARGLAAAIRHQEGA